MFDINFLKSFFPLSIESRNAVPVKVLMWISKQSNAANSIIFTNTEVENLVVALPHQCLWFGRLHNDFQLL